MSKYNESTTPESEKDLAQLGIKKPNTSFMYHDFREGFYQK